MKKLLILMLVLGVATAANAYTTTLYLTDTSGNTTVAASVIGTTITVQIRPTTQLNGIKNVDVSEGCSNIAAVGSWYASPPSGGAGQSVGSSVTSGIDDIIASTVGGDAFDADDPIYEFSAYINNGGTINLAMQSGDEITGSGFMEVAYYSTSDITLNGLTVLPEPMTIALLGLGGLFLRRRR